MSTSYTFDVVAGCCIASTICLFIPLVRYHYKWYGYALVNQWHCLPKWYQFIIRISLVAFILLIERNVYISCAVISSVNVIILSKILTPITWSVAIYIHCMKYYFIHYNQNYLWQQSHHQWKILIDRHYKKKQPNFYMNHSFSYGSITWMIRVTILPFITFILILILFNIFLSEYQFILDFLPFLTIMFLIKYFNKAMTQIIDEYNTYKEIMLQLQFISIACIIKLAISFYYFLFLKFSYLSSDELELIEICSKIESCCYFILGCVVLFGICYISTIKTMQLQEYSTKRFNKYKQWMKGLRNLKNSELIKSFVYIKNINGQTDLANILQNNLGYSLFTQHLVKEYTNELILFLTEITQIKYNYYLKQNKIFTYYIWNERGESKQIVVDYSLLNLENHKYIMFYHPWSVDRSTMQICSEIPETDIIMGEDKENINASGYVYKQMKALYDKYIKSTVDWALPLSSKKRRVLDEVFELETNNKNNDALYINIMDECVKVIRVLLANSYRRFVMTKQYLLYRDQINYDDKPIVKHNVEFYDDMTMYKKLINEYYKVAIAALKKVLGDHLWVIVISFVHDGYVDIKVQ